jgi:hypothetical protein
MNNIYIVRGTEQAGPFTESDIRAKLASGELTGDTMVWWDGLPEWTPLSKTPLMLAAAPAPVSAPATSGAVPAPAPIAPIGDVTTTAPVAAKTSVLAIVSLVTGILGLPMLICSFFALPFQIAAIICGHIALVQIGREPQQTGKGMAIAGLVCGYLGIILIIVSIVALVVLGNQVKDVFATIQSQLNAAAMTNNAPASPNP